MVCDKRICQDESRGVQGGAETGGAVRIRDCGTEEKMRSRAGGHRDEDAELLFGSRADGSEQEREHQRDGWEIKSKRPDEDGTDMMEGEGRYV